MTRQPTPNCPACRSLPGMVLGDGTQAFCVNEDCQMVTWNPTLTASENMRTLGVVTLDPNPAQAEEGPPFCEDCGHFHDDTFHPAGPCPDRRCCIQPPGL